MGLTAELWGDPAVKRWIANYAAASHRTRVKLLADFIRFIRGVEGFRDALPSDLIRFQREAGGDDRFRMLDLLQDYIRGKSGTYRSLSLRYSVVRSFFRGNRAPLPDDDFRIRADKPPVSGRLSVDVIRTLASNVSAGHRAFYLTVWMGLLDLQGFMCFNEGCGSALVDHLREHGSGEPFRIDLPGRKQARNRFKFYTFIGRDALDSWTEYFERIRGWPKPGEPILMDRYGRAYTASGLGMYHIRLLERLRYVKRGGMDSSRRYGYNLHEFRDVARTLLHLKGKSEGLDMECVEFWMGHITDPNNYDKFYLDEDYVKKNYRMAEKHLNILSRPILEGDAEELRRKAEELDRRVKQLEALSKLVESLIPKF